MFKRALNTMFPGFFPWAKHNHYKDFGYPEEVGFPEFKAAYDRNGLGTAAVERTVQKTWEDLPALRMSDKPDLSPAETGVSEYFIRKRLWGRLMEVDRRALIGGYAGAILRIADGEQFDQPVESTNVGTDGLVDIIPAWCTQLTVSEWNTDLDSDDYGKPLMFQFQEASISVSTNTKPGRSFRVHPDRVILWSEDGTIEGKSLLKSGYNNLLDIEKISGAGGEGFWKNAKASPVLEMDEKADVGKMAKAMGIKPEEVLEKIDAQVEDWQRGLDNVLMVQGMKANPLPITLSSPEHFFLVSCQVFAASILMPMKILVGSQTGERASTEDKKEWDATCNSRRTNYVMPLLAELADRLTRFGVVAGEGWFVKWSDLTESSLEEKIERADKMSDINQKHSRTGELVFLPEEIRAVVGEKPLSDEQSHYEVDEFGDTKDE